MAKLEDPPTTVPSSEVFEIESSSEEDYNQKTIFSSDDEDEPIDSPPVLVSEKKKEEVCGSGEAPLVKSGTKRPSEETLTDVNSKRLKKEDEKKFEVDRRRSKIWSDEDEIAILQGMIDFKTDQWRKEGFYETIKKSISFNVRPIQFKEKIRSLKKKYLGQVKKNGFKQSFLRVHDHKCFELCKAIWGPDGIASGQSNGESKKMVLESDDVKSNGESKQMGFESDDLKSNGESKKMAFESDVKGSGESKKMAFESDGKGSGETKKMALESVVKSNGESKKSEMKLKSLKEELLFSSPNGKKVEDDVDVKLPKYDWFEKSFFIRWMESIGVDEHLIKERWSKVQVEAKKRIEDKLKLLQDKEIECALQKTNLLYEVASAMAQADFR
ncbi:putative transcription factor [Cardamine amara subsp. amara]|uniref:Transcription factor n=1 Tax=Cardamine amara subsp. amara TaxID=228776 RepID=A0ABD1C657_CARAN